MVSASELVFCFVEQLQTTWWGGIHRTRSHQCWSASRTWPGSVPIQDAGSHARFKRQPQRRWPERNFV